MRPDALVITKYLLIICLLIVSILVNQWLLIACSVGLILFEIRLLIKKQSVHQDSLSPLNNLLNITDPNTLIRVMDFGLWEYCPDTETFTLSPKSRELLGCDMEQRQCPLNTVMNSIHPIDQQLFLSTFKGRLDGKPMLLEVRAKSEGIYHDWLQFEGSQIHVADQNTILAGKLERATTGVLVKRIETEMRHIITDVLEHRNLDDTLTSICEVVAEIESAIHCVIFMTNQDNKKPRLIQRSDITQEFNTMLSTVTLGHEYSEYVYTLQKRKPLYIANLSRLNAWQSIDGIRFKKQINTYIGQTVYSDENQILGVVALYLPDASLSESTLQLFLSVIHKTVNVAIETHRQIEAKENIQRQLYHSQKMDTLGYLTGGIAHDFNNILGSIIGYNGLTQKVSKKYQDQQLDNYINEVSIAADRARELIDQMMAYSRYEQVEKLLIDPQVVIKEVTKLVRSMLPTSIEINYKYSKELPKILINPISLHQIILNHLINAKDAFVDFSGEIEIDTYLEKSPLQICQSCHQEFRGDYVVIKITDNGSGISPEIQSRIFEPFFTTKDVGRGTGMGLSVVHGLLHEVDAHVVLTTQSGIGTSFRLYFPRQSEQLTANPDSNTLELIERSNAFDQSISGIGQHILVVDDDASLSMFMQELLVSNGFTVSRFVSGVSALKTFAQNPETFDLVLTDQTMPEMTGDEMAKKMLELKPDLPVIVCTGYSEKLTDELADSIGIRKVLKKPVSIESLLDEIANQLSRNPNP